MAVADYAWCGGYNTACATTSCCIYVGPERCGPRFSVNSQICVPKTGNFAKGDMIGLGVNASKMISIALTTAAT